LSEISKKLQRVFNVFDEFASDDDVHVIWHIGIDSIAPNDERIWTGPYTLGRDFRRTVYSDHLASDGTYAAVEIVLRVALHQSGFVETTNVEHPLVTTLL
jgi:hypothetical protein